MTAPEASPVGSRLDEDHVPETNGRMAVCRRCGFRTDGKSGAAHAPIDEQEAKANRWLDGQAQANRVAKVRGMLGS
jgi:hypothetical protein